MILAKLFILVVIVVAMPVVWVLRKIQIGLEQVSKWKAGR